MFSLHTKNMCKLIFVGHCPLPLSYTFFGKCQENDFLLTSVFTLAAHVRRSTQLFILSTELLNLWTSTTCPLWCHGPPLPCRGSSSCRHRRVVRDWSHLSSEYLTLSLTIAPPGMLLFCLFFCSFA